MGKTLKGAFVHEILNKWQAHDVKDDSDDEVMMLIRMVMMMIAGSDNSPSPTKPRFRLKTINWSLMQPMKESFQNRQFPQRLLFEPSDKNILLPNVRSRSQYVSYIDYSSQLDNLFSIKCNFFSGKNKLSTFPIQIFLSITKNYSTLYLMKMELLL